MEGVHPKDFDLQKSRPTWAKGPPPGAHILLLAATHISVQQLSVQRPKSQALSQALRVSPLIKCMRSLLPWRTQKQAENKLEFGVRIECAENNKIEGRA